MCVVVFSHASNSRIAPSGRAIEPGFIAGLAFFGDAFKCPEEVARARIEPSDIAFYIARCNRPHTHKMSGTSYDNILDDEGGNEMPISTSSRPGPRRRPSCRSTTPFLPKDSTGLPVAACRATRV